MGQVAPYIAIGDFTIEREACHRACIVSLEVDEGVYIDRAGAVLGIVGERDLCGAVGGYGSGVERSCCATAGGAYPSDALRLVAHIGEGEGAAHGSIGLSQCAQFM